MKISKKVRSLVLLLLVVLLTGCGGEIVADLYVQDIYKVMEEQDSYMFTTATIALETFGEEYSDDFIGLIESNFSGAGNFRTQTRDFQPT